MVRYKARYLLFEVLYPEGPPNGTGSYHTPSPNSTNEKIIAKAIRDSIALNFGDWGLGTSSYMNVKFFKAQISKGIVRCARDHFRTVWAALTLLRELNGKPVIIRVVRCSGTILKAKKAQMKRIQKEAGASKAAMAPALKEVERGLVDNLEDGELEQDD
ncbi:hypothetical protein BJ508DRAFT_203328 [Ascobolus immersus RN42]|uniref:Uncharacterized protein n=1 Tax=Ascobolus immersus RN42 TaxID=1160509 RepID=A0A3N4IMG1_ASCIM|nr:hypothetical protein BJ508DRAFT_203328 [Ascobolus immersus RN42]